MRRDAVMLCSSQVTPHSGAEVPPENSAGQVVCLVSHGQSNKIIKVGGSKKLEDVRRSLGKSEFGQLCDASFIIQMYNDRFECFVDLDNDTVVPDGAKLKLVVLDSPRTEAAEPYAFLLHYVSKCLCI